MMHLRRNWLWIAIFAVAVALRLWQLGAAEFWYDEAGTIWMAELPFGQMIQATAGDTHPPGYLSIIWVTIRLLGNSEFAARLPSVLFSLLSLWLVSRIANQLNMPRAAIVAVLGWMAVSPFQIHYAQEARMYALLQAEVLLLVLAMLRRQAWLAGLAALSMLYTHNYAVFYLPAVGLYWLWSERHNLRHCALALAALGLPVLFWLPWLFVLIGQMQTVSAGYWIQPPTPGSVIYAVYMLFAAFSMPEVFQPIAVMVYIGTVLYALWRAIKTRTEFAPLLLWLSFAPLGMALAGSALWRPLLLFRGLAGSAPFIYLLIAWALTNVQPERRWYMAVLVVPVTLAGLIGYYQYNVINKGEVRATVARVMQAWTPGDIVYHVNAGSMMTWHIYAPTLPQYVAPPCPDGERTIGDLSDSTKFALDMQLADIDSLKNYRRAFVIWGEGPTSSRCEDARGQALLAAADVFEITQDTDYVRAGVWTRYAKNWLDSQAR